MTVKGGTHTIQEGEEKSQTAKRGSTNISIVETVLIICTVPIIVLEVLMLLLDERFPWLFPYIFGLDLRYVLTIGLAVVGVCIFGILRRKQSAYDDPSHTKSARQAEHHNQ